MNLIQSEEATRGQQATTGCYFYCEERHRNRCLIDRPNKDLYLAGRGRRPRRPEEANSESQKFDRKSFLNCRDRCVPATSCRLSGYANGNRYATTCNLNHSRRCILYRYDIGPSRTPVPTIRKDDRRMFGGNRYDLGRMISSPTNKKISYQSKLF